MAETHSNSIIVVTNLPLCFLCFAEPMGILFYGPPGTGKTVLAKALGKVWYPIFNCKEIINIKLSRILQRLCTLLPQVCLACLKGKPREQLM